MRSFIAAVFTVAAIINFAMWYRPAPAMAAPVKVPSWLKKDKAQDQHQRRDKRCDTPARYEAMSEGANCS